MDNRNNTRNGDRPVIHLDLLFSIAEHLASPADVFNMAMMNSESWKLLEPLAYRKEVTYTKTSQRLQYEEPSDLFHEQVIGAFGGGSLEGIPFKWKDDSFDYKALHSEEHCEWDCTCVHRAPRVQRHAKFQDQYQVLEDRLASKDLNGLLLHRAIKTNNTALIKKLVESARIHNPRGYLDGFDFPIIPSPMHKAAAFNQVGTIRLLLAAGCAPGISFGTSDWARWDDCEYFYPQHYAYDLVPWVANRLRCLHLNCSDYPVWYAEGYVDEGIVGRMCDFTRDCIPPLAFAAGTGSTGACKELIEAQTAGVSDADFSLAIRQAGAAGHIETAMFLMSCAPDSPPENNEDSYSEFRFLKTWRVLLEDNLPEYVRLIRDWSLRSQETF